MYDAMYDAFYGLDENPFAIPPNPAYLYLSEKHKNALSRLRYSILNQSAFAVITGDIGCGKTTLVRELMRNLDRSVTVGLVSNVSFDSFEELMQWILFAFELEFSNKDKVTLFETFTDFVIKNYSANRRTVLIIDEAQNLDTESLEQLRMLSNINVDQHQVLQLILVGQTNLLDTLERPELEQFTQRIEVEYYLKALDLNETAEYIQHRIKVAGGKEDIFTPDAYPVIWNSTGGVPRLINILCGMAMVYAFADLKDKIDAETINHVLKDKKGTFPNQDNNLPIQEVSPKVYSLDSHSTKNGNSHSRGKKKAKGKGAKDMSTIEKLFFNEGD